MIQVEIIFSKSFDFKHELDLFFSSIFTLTLSALAYDPSNERNLLLSEISNYLVAEQRKWFSLVFGSAEVDFSYIADLGFYRLDVKNLCNSIFCVESVVASVLMSKAFVQARAFDCLYDEIQNVKELKYFEIRGLDQSQLKTKMNGLPPPFQAVIVDTSNNPGRFSLKPGYVEFIGSVMWLGDLFWSYVGQDKRQQLLMEDWIQTEILANEVIKLVALDQLFVDETTANKQNRLRELLYGSSNILH